MKILVTLCSLLLINIKGQAQFTSGSGFYIGPQTLVTIDGLALKPSAENFVLRNKTLSVQLRSVDGEGGGSIKRSYGFNEFVRFTGEAGIVYLAEELNQNDESALQLAYTDDRGVYKTSPDSRVNMTEHFVSRSFNAEDLLKMTAVNATVMLPVKLIAFTARKSEKLVSLEWSTAEEVTSDYFEIQRSLDGKQWAVLGKVNAVGESSDLKNYQYADVAPANGNNLYRLKMVDKDGTLALSKVISIDMHEESSIDVYPNPVTDILNIETDKWKDIQSLEMYNLVGNMVRKLNASDASADQLKRSFNFQEMPTGIYTLKSTLSSGKTATYKILKK